MKANDNINPSSPDSSEFFSEERPSATILVVDDDEMIRQLLHEALTMEGYEPITVPSGEEALAALAARDFDVVITDLSMPGMNGLDLIRQTNIDHPHVPKIIITGAGTLENAIEAIRIGAYDYIRKPLDLGELWIVLDRAVKNRRLILSNLEYQRQLQESNQRLEQRVKERTEKLKASETKFRGLFENANDAIVLIDRQGGFRDWNPAALEMLGCTDKKMKQLALDDWIADCDLTWPPLEETLAQGKPISGFEHRILQSGGAIRVVENSSVPLRDSLGRIRGYQMMLRDITKRKQAEEEIQRKNEELVRSMRLKDDFLSHLSHEILTPLAPLKGYLSIVRQSLDDPTAVEESLEAAGKEAARLQQLLEGLIDLSNLVLDKADLVKMPVDLNSCIARSIEAERENAAKRELEISSDLDPELPRFLADPSKIEQIITNLFANAIKFSENGAVVTLVSSRRGGQVCLEVSDSGIGIPPEEQSHIFDAFHQIDGSTRRKHGGIGIGLSLVKQLVELHGGSIELESQPGTGSTFTILIPLIEA